MAGVTGSASLRQFESVEAALDAALADSTPDDGVLVFGSFLTAAAAGNHWRSAGRGSAPGTPTTSPG
jgi:folylpolyglutamate synthase/dihydropteroate synthase